MTHTDQITKTEYQLGHNTKVGGIGISIKKEKFNKYFSDRIEPYNDDVEGVELIKQTFPDLHITGFDPVALRNTMSSIKVQGDLGESIATCYLSDYYKSHFPYRPSHDLKNPKTDLHGADLVGFFKKGVLTIFQFGEVKTSGENAQPPQVVTKSSDGLTTQLKNLKTNKMLRQNLLLWLGHKVKKLNSTDNIRKKYSKAAKNYGNDIFGIIGVLIRDTKPDKKDLQSSFDELSTNLNSGIHLKLLAIYLPISLKILTERLCDK